MTLHSTKKNLLTFLADTENKVVALSGNWGTGKSHLWREIQSNSKDNKIRNSLYASLFGLTDINQLKVKLLQDAIPFTGEKSELWKKTTAIVKSTKDALKSIHRGFSAIDDLAQLAIPSLLKDKFIVLDDIERKHNKLSIDEILGFIDDYTQNHNARFLLILNSDQLKDKESWETFREKVIDHEIHLRTTTEESIEVAENLSPTKYSKHILNASKICRITNIRIIRKIIKIANKILDNHGDLSEDILSRVLPSTVLLSAIHYRAIPDGPTFDFVLSQGTSFREFLNSENEPHEEAERKSKWKQMLNELGILISDEYEEVVINFLKSGLIEEEAVSKIITRYKNETERLKTLKQLENFYTDLKWNHKVSAAQLLEYAKSISCKIHHLDARNFTYFHDDVKELQNGEELANEMMERWIEEFKKLPNEAKSRSNFNQSIHPRIKEEIDLQENSEITNHSIFDAIKHIIDHSGWSNRQEMVMKRATVSDFENTIKNLSPQDLQIFLPRMMEFARQSKSYAQHFGKAPDNFLTACKNIAEADPYSRLTLILERVFSETKIHILSAS